MHPIIMTLHPKCARQQVLCYAITERKEKLRQQINHEMYILGWHIGRPYSLLGINMTMVE